MSRIEIPLSKKKIVLLVCVSVLFVVSGIFLFTTIADEQTRFDPTFVKGVGIAGVIFFGATGIYGIRKMFDSSVGLIIDENGITDRSNATSVGFIPWADITEIRRHQVASTKFLLIYTQDPDKYLEGAKGLKRMLLKANKRSYGTPLSITSTTLRYDFDEVERLIAAGAQAYQNRTNH